MAGRSVSGPHGNSVTHRIYHLNRQAEIQERADPGSVEPGAYPTQEDAFGDKIENSCTASGDEG